MSFLVRHFRQRAWTWPALGLLAALAWATPSLPAANASKDGAAPSAAPQPAAQPTLRAVPDAAARDDATCRAQAIQALERLAFPDAVEILQGFARASDPQAGKEARDALKKLATEFPSALPANAAGAALFVYPRQALFLDREPRTATP